mmetsp:Transcript_76496/g.203150  ORF Transcript_76496/g.203150 Transcript_76496/m.203150 type:complete len:320 (-) Transcript_76496:834-1793(-)
MTNVSFFELASMPRPRRLTASTSGSHHVRFRLMLLVKLPVSAGSFLPAIVTCTEKPESWTFTSSSFVPSSSGYRSTTFPMVWLHSTPSATPPAVSHSNFRRQVTFIFTPSGSCSINSDIGRCFVTNLAAVLSFPTIVSILALVSFGVYAPAHWRRLRAFSKASTFFSSSALPSSSMAFSAAARGAVMGGSSPRLPCACAMTVCKAACSRACSSLPLCALRIASASCAARSASSTRSLRKCRNAATLSMAAWPFQSPVSLMRAQARLAACMAPSSSAILRFVRRSLCSHTAIFSPLPAFLAAVRSTLAFLSTVSDLPSCM